MISKNHLTWCKFAANSGKNLLFQQAFAKRPTVQHRYFATALRNQPCLAQDCKLTVNGLARTAHNINKYDCVSRTVPVFPDST